MNQKIRNMKFPGPHHIGLSVALTDPPFMLTFSCGPDNIFDQRPAAPAQIVECPEHGKFIALLRPMLGVDLAQLNVLGNPSPVLLVSLDDVEFASQLVN